MTEGTITRWLVEEGGTVTEGQPLFEMETDKLTITIDATHSGTLLKIIRGEGDVVPITETIAIIGEPGEDYSSLLDEGAASGGSEAAEGAVVIPPVAKEAVAATEGKRIFSTPRARLRAEERNLDYRLVPGTGPEGLIIERDVLSYVPPAAAVEPKATPLAKKVAALEGIELAAVSGSGSRGKIRLEDVRAKLSQSGSAVERGEKVIPLSSMRKVIATRMHESLQIMAQANHRMSVDMTQATGLREQLKAAGIKVSYNDIVIRCVAKALTEFPMMNASFTEQAIIQKEYVHIGMAVAVDSGLIVPVIRDADLMTLPQIAAVTAQLAQKAKSGALQPEDYTGGTFTVTNLGMFDVDSFTAIINPPEVGILAVGKISKQAVVQEDDSILVKPMMQLSLTYDHRAVDGAPAAQFLKRIKTLLESPGLLI